MLLYKRHACGAKKNEHTSELREQSRGICLEKEDNQERESCVWRRKIKSVVAFEKDN